MGSEPCSIPNSLHPVPHDSGIYDEGGGEEKLEKPEVVSDPKERASSGYIRADTHMNSQRL